MKLKAAENARDRIATLSESVQENIPATLTRIKMLPRSRTGAFTTAVYCMVNVMPCLVDDVRICLKFAQNSPCQVCNLCHGQCIMCSRMKERGAAQHSTQATFLYWSLVKGGERESGRVGF